MLYGKFQVKQAKGVSQVVIFIPFRFPEIEKRGDDVALFQRQKCVREVPTVCDIKIFADLGTQNTITVFADAFDNPLEFVVIRKHGLKQPVILFLQFVAALKENGIGRPSTRAAIIETLFRRRYIRKEKKNLIATPTGVELIGIIHEELLKSAELTGIWERKLRQIEHREYEAKQFIDELKQMVTEIVSTVLADNSTHKVSETP